MKRQGSPVAAASTKRKKSRGRRKSKAERLARRDGADSSPADLEKRLASTSSRDWDAAQALAHRIGSQEARSAVVRGILERHGAPRAAAHYAKRLNLQSDELLALLSSIPTLSPLATAQFLVELDDQILSTNERLRRFLWPWLLQSVAEKQKEDRAVLKAAAHLLLHPTASSENDTTSTKLQDKNERGRGLQRALVEKCLQTGKLLHLVPTHARAFRSKMKSWTSAEPDADAEEDNSDTEQEWQTEKKRRLQVADRVQNVLRLLWPDARVLLFGSSATGLLPLGGEGSSDTTDVDLCALLPSALHFRQETAPLVAEVKEHLTLYMLPDAQESELDVTAVTRARVPIVHFRDPTSSLPCDLCVNNLPALWNTQLLRWLLYGGKDISLHEQHQLSHARRLCIWVRKWRRSKKRAVGGALSSYGLMLLVIYYLQRAGVLPVIDCSANVVEDRLTLECVTERGIDEHLGTIDKNFVSADDLPKHVQDWRVLRHGFFRFFTCDFDYDQTVVCLRTTDIVSKASKGWAQQGSTRLSVEDPVETDRNLGGLCSRRALGRLRCAFAHACVVLADKEAKEEMQSGAECISRSETQSVELELLASWAYDDEVGLDTHEDEFSHGKLASQR